MVFEAGTGQVEVLTTAFLVSDIPLPLYQPLQQTRTLCLVLLHFRFCTEPVCFLMSNLGLMARACLCTCLGACFAA